MAACIFAVSGTPPAPAETVTYAAPPGVQASEDYEVEADGKDVFVYPARVFRGPPASFAYFDFAGAVTVTVTCPRAVRSAKVLPTSYGIQPKVSGKQVTFTLARPANVTLELNGSHERALHLFANPIETDRPDPNDEDVIYFGPGIHDVTTLRPKSGQTIYIAGGAVLRAHLPADEPPVHPNAWRGQDVWAPLIETRGVQNVTVRGRGILDMKNLKWLSRIAMLFRDSRDILVEGIIFKEAPLWGVVTRGSSNVVVRNVKQICPTENADGIDLCNTQNALVEDCFFRNNDDAVSVKTMDPPPAMASRNITVQRCVVWNERARGLGITSNTKADISDVVFRDCDIIHDFASYVDCAALAVLVSDSGTMSNIRFEDIRVEDCRKTLAICWVGKDMWSREDTRGHIKGVTFHDITVSGRTSPVIKLKGHSEEHRVQDVRFERLRIKGKLIDGPGAVTLQTNAFVRGLTFDVTP